MDKKVWLSTHPRRFGNQMSHFQANMGAWNPGGNDKLVNRLVGCLWPSWRHSKVKLTTSRTSRIFENGGVVVVVFFFWCIKDQCGFTFDQGNSLIISWKLRDKAFWSILVCSRFGKLCVRVVVFRSHKCYPTNIIFSNGRERHLTTGKREGDWSA